MYTPFRLAFWGIYDPVDLPTGPVRAPLRGKVADRTSRIVRLEGSPRDPKR